jgi:formylglycine-generating enzyme required for sulfatase activity/tRNA A-37 threonylcarbamoyl transferase component Bud32
VNAPGDPHRSAPDEEEAPTVYDPRPDADPEPEEAATVYGPRDDLGPEEAATVYGPRDDLGPEEAATVYGPRDDADDDDEEAATLYGPRDDGDDDEELPTMAGGPPSLGGSSAVAMDTDLAHAPTLVPGSSKPSSVSSKSSKGVLRSRRRSESGGVLPSSTRGSGERMSGGDLTEGIIYADKYGLSHEIARGGMGVVYKARQIDLNRIVALKVMLSGTMAGEEERRRFILEAEASARLKHPNIVPVFDIGESGGNLYFTMDFVEGEPLSVRKASLSREQLQNVMIRVCDAVAYAHQRGIIHRDLKPANVMMNASDEPLIMDFGLAKQVEVVDADGQPSLMTRDGSIMGTPHYMPPEQAEGRVSDIDIRSDVWALGVILYELFAGELPFTGRNVPELLRSIFSLDPKPPRQIDPSLDWDLEAIVLTALEKEKDRRYQSAAELRDDLARVRDGLPIQAARATWVYRLRKWLARNRAAALVGMALVVMGALTLGALHRQSRQAEIAAEAAYTEAYRQGSESRDRLQEAMSAFEAAQSAFLAGGSLSERRQGVDVRLVEAADLSGEIDAARGLLTPYTDSHTAARQLIAGGLDPLRDRLVAEERRLARLRDVHKELGLADEAMQAARDGAVAAEEAIGQGGEDRELTRGWSSLEVALADAEALNAPALDAGKGSEGQATWEAFDATSREVRQHLYAAMSLCGDDPWPEAKRAEARLDEVNTLRARVEGKRDDVARVLEARAMHERGGEALALLEQAVEAGVDTQVRLRGARLAQGALAKGLQADASYPGLRQRSYQANEAYARALLAMKAYEVFDVELLSDEAFTDEAREALKAAKEAAQAATRDLETELNGLAQKLAAAKDLAGLEPLVARLEELGQDAGLSGELDLRRQDLLNRARAALDALRREEALREIDRAVAAARRLEAGSDDQSAAVDERLAAWESVRRLHREKEPIFGAAATQAGELRAVLAAGKICLEAGGALEERDPAEALAVARRGRDLVRPFEQQDEEAESQADLLGKLVARLERLEQKPEGMVLIRGREKVEFGSGPEDRNPPRRLDVGSFYLAEREVTCAEYAAFVNDPRYADPAFWKRLKVDPDAVPRWPQGWKAKSPPRGTRELPVTGVSWHEARGYAAWRRMRLPTDREWEYAVRYQDGGERAFPWGEAFAQGRLSTGVRPPGANGRDRTSHGVFDMGGNVSEWVVLEDLEARVQRPAARGASFLYPRERIARATHRLRPRPSYRGPQLGFRLAKDAK